MARDFRRHGLISELAEMSYLEIAEITGLTRDQVFYAEKTALAKLRKKLAHYEEDVRDARQSERHGCDPGCYSVSPDRGPGGLRDMQEDSWSKPGADPLA